VTTLVASLGCYRPTTAEGIPCSEAGRCPDGQTCGPDQTCRASCGSGCADASTPDLDERPAIGTMILTGAAGSEKCLGTLVGPSAVLTRAGCTSAEEIFFQGQAHAIITSAIHPDHADLEEDEADLGLLFLSQPVAYPPIALSTAPAVEGIAYDAVWPINDLTTAYANFEVPVVPTAIEERRFLYTSPVMSSPFSCPSPGGPTLDSSGAIVGLHSRSPCEGTDYADIRIDVYRAWIEAEVAANGPESCDGFEPQRCPNPDGCGMTRCDGSGGEVEVSCERQGPSLCDEGETCTDESLCQPVEPTPECQAGTYRLCGTGDCGWQWCNPDTLAWFPCDAESSLCASPGTEECIQSGSSFTCVTVTCSTSTWSGQCAGIPVPGSVPAGETWDTSSGCTIGKCRTCSCTDDNDGDAAGLVSCGACD
jgi:hypothetical protein